jgi:copper chaperone CopZ
MGMGLSAAGAAAFFEHYRLVFLVAAALLLAVGFYLNYFRKKSCGPDEACARPNPKLRRFNRGMLWFSTVLVIAFAFFPNYIGLLFGAQGTSAQTTAVSTETWTLRIDGMTCAGCEAAVTTALSAVPGVLDSRASYEDRTAIVTVDRKSLPSRMGVSLAIAGIGYTLVESNSPPSPGRSLAGHWLATSETEDGQEFEIILDLGQVGSRWVGQFDLPTFNVENYPVEVTVGDSLIELHFTAMTMDFKGVLSSDSARLSGRAIQRGQQEDWELVFERTGEASLSELFLKLEGAADDTTAVHSLSNDARELRAAFNRDTDKVRLLLLLAPS